MVQNVHALWAHPMVTWTIRLLASLGGLYTIPSYLKSSSLFLFLNIYNYSKELFVPNSYVHLL